METRTQHGYLVLADISGYTSFLAKTELEHAHEILTELLNLIVSKFSSVLIFSKFEGDAVFAHVPEVKLSRGETLLELVEATYVAFRDHLQTCARRTTCTCNACRAIPSLDLKFMVHHGDYIIQELANGKELVGSDVNLVHRLMKNHVTETTGMRAYAMFSEKSLEHMCVHPEEMHKQVENYEHLGDVPTYSLDMHQRYKELTEIRHVYVTPEEATATISQDFPVAPPVLWDWLNDPHKRNLYNVGTKWSLKPTLGRTGPGAINHCAHGKNYGEAFVEHVVDWRPFEYFTSVGDLHMGVTFKLTRTQHLTATATGTHLVGTLKMESPLPGFLNKIMGKMMLTKTMVDPWILLLSILQSQGQNQGSSDNHAGHTHELTPAH